MASADLVWELVRGNNAFLKKGLNGTVFSAERGNLRNASTRRSSGLANYGKTIDVAVAGDFVEIARPVKKTGKLAPVVVKKTNPARINRAAKAAARAVRPEIEQDAAVRASAVAKVIARTKAINAAQA